MKLPISKESLINQKSISNMIEEIRNGEFVKNIFLI